MSIIAPILTLITPFSDVLHTLHVLQNLPLFTVMGETIESQPSNKLILDTCLSCSEVFYRNRGCEKAPLAFLASTFFGSSLFRVLYHTGYR